MCSVIVLIKSYPTQLGSQRVSTVATYIQENNIPWPFVGMLFAHFMLMVIDRLAVKLK